MGEHLKPPLTRIPPEVAAVSDYEPLARERMTQAAWSWLQGGAADEITVRENQAAFQRLRLAPRVLADLAGGHTRLTLLGQAFDHPVFVAPVAYQQLAHPDGEMATALAASALGAGMVVSTQTETVRQLRRGVMELYLSDHPEDCDGCARGNCEIQALATTVGSAEVRYGRPESRTDVAHPHPIDDSNPYFSFDSSLAAGALEAPAGAAAPSAAPSSSSFRFLAV